MWAGFITVTGGFELRPSFLTSEEVLIKGSDRFCIARLKSLFKIAKIIEDCYLMHVSIFLIDRIGCKKKPVGLSPYRVKIKSLFIWSFLIVYNLLS